MVDVLLLVLALAAQTADAAVSCRQIRAGTHREFNPVYGQSCARMVTIKGALLLGAVQLPRREQRWVLGGLAVSGGAGVALSLTLGK